VTDNASVDANDVPVEADFLSVARTDTREGTNKTGVATHFVPVVTDSIGEGTNKTGVATHFLPVVTDSIGEGAKKTDVATTNTSYGSERSHGAGHEIPIEMDSPSVGATPLRVVSARFLVETTKRCVEDAGTHVATVEPL